MLSSWLSLRLSGYFMLENRSILAISPCWKGRDTLARALLDHGADLLLLNRDLRLPLHLATMMGHVVAVQLIYSENCSMSLTDSKGRTVLDYADLRRKEKAVSMLTGKESVTTTNSEDAASLKNHRGQPTCVCEAVASGATASQKESSQLDEETKENIPPLEGSDTPALTLVMATPPASPRLDPS